MTPEQLLEREIQLHIDTIIDLANFIRSVNYLAQTDRHEDLKASLGALVEDLDRAGPETWLESRLRTLAEAEGEAEVSEEADAQETLPGVDIPDSIDQALNLVFGPVEHITNEQRVAYARKTQKRTAAGMLRKNPVPKPERRTK